MQPEFESVDNIFKRINENDDKKSYGSLHIIDTLLNYHVGKLIRIELALCVNMVKYCMYYFISQVKEWAQPRNNLVRSLAISHSLAYILPGLPYQETI